jgi:ATP-dependent Clp protease ATP-binding subunit ClpA
MSELAQMYTERVKGTLRRAAELSRARGHGYLGTEHLILALIDDTDGIAGGVMERLGCARAVRDEVVRIMDSDGYFEGSTSETGSDPIT